MDLHVPLLTFQADVFFIVMSEWEFTFLRGSVCDLKRTPFSSKDSMSKMILQNI